MNAPYLYLARRLDGTRTSGVLSAESWHTAATELMERGLTVIFLDRHQSLRSLLRPSIRFRNTSEKARRSFYRALGTLLSAGCSFSRSFEICIERTDSEALLDALKGAYARVRSGRALSDALAGMPREFPFGDIALIRAGEKMGNLDAALLRLAEKLDKKGDLRERIIAAIAYPAWVFLASVAIVATLAATTLPSIESLLKELGARPTGLLAISIVGINTVERPITWLWLAPTIAIGIVGAAALQSRPGIALARESVLLRLPIVGKIFADRCAGEFFSTCGDLLDAGVGIVEAIALGADAAQNQLFRRSARMWIARIEAGETWSSSMAEDPFIDRLTKTMIELGEETGALPQLLDTIGTHRLSEGAMRLRLITSFIEPAAILVIGCMVAVFVSGVLIPIYNAIGGIR